MASFRPWSLAYGPIRALRNLIGALVIGSGAALAEPVVVAALGDSLTQGYGLPTGEGLVPQLQAWLDGEGIEARLINAGVSGDTTAGGLARVDWTLTEEVDRLIVALGGNDMLRGLPPEEARANLAGILDAAGARGVEVLLVGLEAPGNYGTAYRDAYAATYADLAETEGALLMPDLFGPLRDLEPGAVMQADMLHPNAEGVARIVESLGPLVVRLIEGE